MASMLLGVRPHPQGKRLGLPDELQVGWIVAAGTFLAFASCKNDDALNRLVKDLRVKFPAFEIYDSRYA